MAACSCWSWPSHRAGSPVCSRARESSFAAGSAPMADMLRVENISHRFGGLLALDRAAFFVEPGQIVALVGPNGAGKTTLFSVITGFLAPNNGRVLYQGDEITGVP